MVGRRWLPWINPTSATSDKQEQEMSSESFSSSRIVSRRHVCPLVGLSALCLLLLVSCVALSVLYNYESDGRPVWRSLLFDYQNMSESYLSLSEANSDLRGDNEMLKEQSVRLDQQTQLLNRTSDKLLSLNLALSLENTEFMEQILNLTSTNLRLTREQERLVQRAAEQEERRLNMSQTIRRLAESNARREDEQGRLSDINGLLRDELLQVREENRELVEINDKFRGEIKNLSERIGALSKNDCEEATKHKVELQERVTELQGQNQNLSHTLMKDRQEAAERQSQMERMHSAKEAYESLDLYCPVVNPRTKERICRKCRDGWRLFENKCYHFSSGSLSWSSSRAWCQTQGGDLLVIDSEAEQRFVFESSQTVEHSATRLWIGMTDAEEEGDWFWVDGSSVTSHLQFWLSRPGLGTEPDDWKLDDPRGEDCGHIDTSEDALRSWMDGSCNRPYRWICEQKV